MAQTEAVQIKLDADVATDLRILAATRRQRPRDIVTKALQDYFRKEGYQRPDGKNKNRKTS